MSKKRYSDSGSTGYYGYSSESRNTTNNKPSKKKNSPLGTILMVIQLILSIALVGFLVYINLDFITLPILIGIIAVLIILFLIVFFMQNNFCCCYNICFDFKLSSCPILRLEYVG